MELGGVSFFLVHNRQHAPQDLGDVQVVVFGHSHVYMEERLGGRLWLNPGSCAWPRFGGGISMAVMTVEDGAVQVERIDLE